MKTKERIKFITNIFVWIIFTLSLLAVIFSFSQSEGVPNIFGRGYLTVQTDSMEPTFNVGDLIFVKTTDANDIFNVDDIVTFKTIINGQEALNTHRITQVHETVVGGQTLRTYNTKGDKVGLEEDLEEITTNQIVALYTEAKIGGLGSVIDYMQSQSGFLVMVVIPLGLIFIYQIVNFALVLSDYNKDGKPKTADNVDFNALTEEQKAALAKQYMDSLNSNKDEKNS